MQAGIHASSGVRSADPASQHQRSARNITSLHLPAPRHLQRHQLQHVPASGVQQGPAVACRAAATTTPEIAVAVPAPRQQPAATGTSSHPVTNNPTAADEIAQANAQSLVTLEWPAICRQVRSTMYALPYAPTYIRAYACVTFPKVGRRGAQLLFSGLEATPHISSCLCHSLGPPGSTLH